MEAASKIVTTAAFADQWLGNILVALSPENAVRLADHLNSLENDAKKTASFEAIASCLLSQDMQELLRLIVKKHRSANKLRNPFAHHRFGFTDDDADLLLLIDPKRELIHRAERETLDARRPKTDDEKKVWFAARTKSATEFEGSIHAYTLAELVRIEAELSEAASCFTSFWQLVSKKPPEPIRAEILAQLTARLGN